MDLRQIVRERAQAHGVDPNIAEAVMMTESGGKPDALSPAGAYGPMQLMEPTARGLGVDRKDPYQNIDGGVRYLKENLTRFNGDTASALAAYNAGPGRVSKSADFANLPPETRNYVPKVMNMAATFADAGRSLGHPAPAQPSGGSGSIDMGSLHNMLGKASAANDTGAVAEIQGALKQQYGSMLAKAQAANDAEAVAEIQGAMQQFGGQARTTQPAPVSPPPQAPAQVAKAPAAAAPSPKARTALESFGLGTRNVLEGMEQAFTYPVRAVGEAAASVAGLAGQQEMADRISRAVGMKNRGGGAVVADAAGLAKPETKAEKVMAEGVKAAAGLATGTGVAKMAEKAPKAIQSALSILMPGTSGSIGQVAKDVGIYGGLGASMEAAPAETAAGLAVLTAASAGGRKVMTTRKTDKIISKAGTVEGARIDAEAAEDLVKAVGNGNRRDQELVTNALNDVANRYVGEVRNAVKRVDPGILKTIDVEDILQGKKTVTGDDLMKIMGTPSGDALAGAITKYQRLNSMTQQGLVNNSLPALAVRGVAAATPAAVGGLFGGIPGAVAGAIMGPKAQQYAAMATGKTSRADAASSVIKNIEAYRGVLAKRGGSQAGMDISAIKEMGRAAEATAIAKKAAGAAEQKAAQEAGTLFKTLNKEMGIKPRPMKSEKISGGTNAVLQYHTGLGPDELNRGLSKIAEETPALAPYMDKLLNNKTVGSRDILTGTTDRLLKMVDDGFLTAETKAAASKAKAAGKGNPFSAAVNKMSDDEVSALLGRSLDTLGDGIKDPRAYLVGQVSKAAKDYKRSPDKVPPETIELLRKFGVVN